jgi:nucleoside-diphosphate-sugar epimerase
VLDPAAAVHFRDDGSPEHTYLPAIGRTRGQRNRQVEALGLKGPLNSETAWMAVLYHWFDAGKARRELGFKPRPAADALAASVRWMKEHGMA